METRDVLVDRVHFVEALDEWRSEGVVSRYGLELRWRGWRPGVGGAWDVEVPNGQMTGTEGEEVRLLVYEGDPPLVDDIRWALDRTDKPGFVR